MKKSRRLRKTTGRAGRRRLNQAGSKRNEAGRYLDLDSRFASSGRTNSERACASLGNFGQAVECPIIRVELWAGVGKDHERQMLREMEQRIPDLVINDEVWDLACELADRCRKAGKRVPPNDLIIEACARFHGVEVEAADAHFDFLKTL